MAGSEASETAQSLVQRLTPSLRRFASALSVDRDRALAADEIVGAALERLGPLSDQPESLLKITLYAAVVHAHRNRRPVVPSEGDKAPRPGRAPIVRAIERLPIDQREVLLLVVLEKLSYDEVAKVLVLPRSSIVARLARARSALSLAGEEASHRPAYLRIVK